MEINKDCDPIHVGPKLLIDDEGMFYGPYVSMHVYHNY